jgi:hypothetical protein
MSANPDIAAIMAYIESQAPPIPPVIIVQSAAATEAIDAGNSLLALSDAYLKEENKDVQFQLEVSIKDAFRVFCEKWTAYNAEVALDPSKKSIIFRNWLSRNDDELDQIRELVHGTA